MWPGDSIPQPLAVIPISIREEANLSLRSGKQGRGSPDRGTRARARGAMYRGIDPELDEGGEKNIVTFTDLVTYFRARFGVEEGQTMAEYGVVLAVITALIVAALLALSGAIANAIDTVRGYL